VADAVPVGLGGGAHLDIFPESSISISGKAARMAKEAPNPPRNFWNLGGNLFDSGELRALSKRRKEKRRRHPARREEGDTLSQ